MQTITRLNTEKVFDGLSEREKDLMIQKALSEVVMEQITWFRLPNEDKNNN